MKKGLTTIILLSCFFSFMGCEEELPLDENGQPIENNQPEEKSTLETFDASDIGLFTAVLHGKNGLSLGEDEDYTIGFQLSTDSLFSDELTKLCIADSIASDSTFSFSISRGVGYNMDMPALEPGTTYYARSFIILREMALVARTISFKTVPVEITTGIIDTVTNTIDCKVNLFKDDCWVDGILGVCYGKNPDPTIDDNILSNDNKDIILQEDGTYSVTIDFPIFGSIFYYRAYYYHNGKTYYGETRSTFKPYDYVDLGLSVNWATCNVGASTEFEYGEYYAWGETEPKSNYDWSTYKWCEGSRNTMTKYWNRGYYGNEEFSDTLTVLSPEDDVAHVKWGGSWRMPTQPELNELRDNCTWSWRMLNGVYGCLITSNKTGFTDRSIFLPAAGCYDWRLERVGYYGNYWSSSVNSYEPYYAHCLDLTGGYEGWGIDRYYGLSVRPVCPVNVESFAIECDELLIVGNTCSLNTVINGAVRYVGYIDINWSSDNESVATVNSYGQVTGLSTGAATITATCMDKTASFTIKVVEESEIPHEFVDLGLSVKWATFNVGATRQEEFGRYYGWGETEVNTTSDDYKWGSWETVIVDMGRGRTMNMEVYSYTKYNGKDSLTVLDPEDDVAHVKWGGSWRMPTMAEQDELYSNCTWTWYASGNKEFNGVAGYKVTSNKEGYTDCSIFLPAAGCRNGTNMDDVGYIGCYWTSSICTDDPSAKYGNAYYLYLYSYEVYSRGYDRRNGLSVRPVCP